MLNVRARLQRDVEAMKDLAALPPEARRTYRKSQQTPVVEEPKRSQKAIKAVPEVDKTLLEAHPTVLISTAPLLQDVTRGTLQLLHDGIQETSRQAVLEQRRQHAVNDLHGLMKQIFAHYTDDNPMLPRKKAALRVMPTILVPTMQELLSALSDERMHFDELYEGTKPEAMHQSIARQLQWLITELGKAKEHGETYENQYKLLLLDYGRRCEEVTALQKRSSDLESQLGDQIRTLNAERAHSIDAANEAATQIAALRDKLREQMEASLGMGNSRPGNASRSGGALPPLRSLQRKGGALAALLGGDHGTSVTPAQRSGNNSHSTTPRGGGHGQVTARGQDSSVGGGGPVVSPRQGGAAVVSPRQGALTPPPPQSYGAALSLDEKEKYLNMVQNLKKEIEELKGSLSVANEETETMKKLAEGERDRVEVALKSGEAEGASLRQLLQAVRDGHQQQLVQLEKTLTDAKTKANAQDKAIDTLQMKLKESTARLLSLQNLLLSGPSVQTLLMTAATSREEAQDAADSLGDLADRITNFADEFSNLSGEDVAALKAAMKEHLEKGKGPEGGDGDKGPSSEPHPAEVTPSAANGVTSASEATPAHAAGGRRRKPVLADTECQTDEVMWLTHDSTFVAGGPVTTVPSAASVSNTPLSPLSGEEPRPASPIPQDAMRSKLATPASRARTPSTGQGTRPAGAAGSISRKASGASLGRKNSILENITEEIAVSVAGENGAVFVSELDLPAEIASPASSSVASPTSKVGGGGRTKSMTKSGSSASLKGGTKPGGKLANAKRGSSGDIQQASSVVFETDDAIDSDKENDELEQRQKAQKQAENELMKKIASQSKVRGISSTNLGDLGSDATNEISQNLERMTILRKQLGQYADQIHQLQQQLEQQKKATQEVQEKLEDQAKLHARDAEKITQLVRQVELERTRAEKMSERVSTLLGESTGIRERLSDLEEEKAELEENLNSKIEALQKVIRKFQEADERSAMIDRERQFLEVCERAIRCLMSAEATSSCPLCLSRLNNPITLAPCGHTFCEQCFLLYQSEHNISLPIDAYDAVQMIFDYRRNLVKFHDDEEKAQSDFLSGLIPLPPEPKKPPRAPTGFLSRSSYVRAITGCSFRCPDCDKANGSGYLQQARLEELCTKLLYLSSVVEELQQMGKARYAEEVRMSDPNAEIQLELVIADKSKKTLKQQYVDLEATPPNTSSDDDE